MAKGPAVPLAQGQAVATAAVREFGPWCERIEVAGSVRRGRPQVHDVDLVLIPRSRDLVRLLEAGRRVGRPLRVADKIWKFATASSVVVDVYLATEETWPTILFVRTGSAAHNVWLAARAQSQGLRWHADGRGIEDARGRLLRVQSEADIFAALGLPYREPAARER